MAIWNLSHAFKPGIFSAISDLLFLEEPFPKETTPWSKLTVNLWSWQSIFLTVVIMCCEGWKL